MATLNELFETYVNDNFSGVMSEAAIVKAYELLLGLTGDFPAKDERVQFWVDKELTVSDFVDEFLTTAARLSTEKAAAWGETVTARTAVVTAAQNAAATATTLEEVGTVVATTLADTQPQTFTLTTGTDSGDSFKGGAGDDTYTASLLTLTSADVLDGGAGTDTLTAEINGSVAATTEIANIENIVLTSFGANTVNLDKITGVTSLTSKNSTGAVTLEKAVATTALGFEGSSTNNITANYAAGALAGSADALTVNLNAASSVALDVDSGFESATINLTGSNSLTTLTVPGVTTLALAGSGDLALKNTLSGFTTVSAAGMTGALKGNTISTATGLSTEGFTGHANGTSVLLGSGADNIKFTDATSSGKSNTLKLGAGNDTLHVLTAGAGATYVFAEAGDDAVTADGLASTDLVDLGEGTDTLTLTGTNVAVLRGVENVTVDAGATLDVNSADSSLTVTAKVNGGAASVQNLSAGSTVSVQKSSTTASAATNVTATFSSTEASSTIDIASGLTGGITLDKITNATVNIGAASALTGAVTTTSTTTDLTINATGALSGDQDIASTDNKLANLTISGTDAVDFANVTSSSLATVSATAAQALDIGNMDSTKLTSVTATSTGSSAQIGNLSASAGTLSAVTVNVTGATTATVGTINTGAAGKVGDLTYTATNGLLNAGAVKASDIGTVSYTSTAGAIQAGAIATADSAGATVNFNGKTFISANGTSVSSQEIAVSNTAGSITSSVSGAAAADIDYTVSAGKGVVNLTATNTGGLESIITNGGASGSSSTITLGNAASGKSNNISIEGKAETLTVTGGTGNDNISLTSTVNNEITTGTFNLGEGTDSVSFAAFDATGANAAAYNGVVINLGSSTLTLTNGTASASVSSGQVKQFDHNATTNTATVDSVGSVFTLSGVETVTGTANADYIVANAAGSTINTGAGDDYVINGAGVDTIDAGTGNDDIVYNAATDGGLSVITITDTTGTTNDFTATAGTTVDSITTFTTTEDEIKIDGALQSALNSTNDSANGTDDTAILLAADGAIDADAGTVFIFDTEDDLAGDNFGDVSDVIATWNTTNGGTPANWNANQEVVFAVGNDAGTQYGIYYLKDVDGNGDIGANDQIALIAITDAAALAATDFVF